MIATPASDYFDCALHDVTNLLSSDCFCAKLRPGALDHWDKNLLRRVD
jgi:hypothetical protein